VRRLVLVLLVALPLLASADERILEFHSEITVMQDGWLEVTETIRVRAEGDRIRRGIYREFPTEYFDRLGNRYVVDFQPLAVFRNGAPEAFHAVEDRNGVRTYFGQSDRYIDPGVHAYHFRYRASRMLGYFEDHDELYWNVTGFDWAFPIDRGSATVRFDFALPAASVATDGYTGPYGSQNQAYSAFVDEDGAAHFEADAPLGPLNGLTIVVMWPKGFVTEPTALDRAGWLLKDNVGLLVALAGFAGVLAYAFPVWSRYGKDPEEGVLVTCYEPPRGFSPASLRYIRQMYYDNKSMTAAILSLAVKGYLRINDLGSKHTLFRLEPGADAPPLATGEGELYEALFKEGDRIVLEQDNHELLGDARTAHRASLVRDYNMHYFRLNALLNIPSILIALSATALAVLGPRSQGTRRDARLQGLPGGRGKGRDEPAQPAGKDAAAVRGLPAVRARTRRGAGVGREVRGRARVDPRTRRARLPAVLVQRVLEQLQSQPQHRVRVERARLRHQQLRDAARFVFGGRRGWILGWRRWRRRRRRLVTDTAIMPLFDSRRSLPRDVH
jgi:hypothetical protein